MRKKYIIAAAVALAAVVILLVVGIAIGRGMGSGATSTPESNTPPGLSESQSTAPGNSQSASATHPQTDSIPFVGPIDSPIIGRWMYDLSQLYEEQLESYTLRVIYEYLPDGTVNCYSYHYLDEDYPENWKLRSGDFRFDTWRGQDVLYTAAFSTRQPFRVEFGEENGVQVMYMFELLEDGGEINFGRYLRQEE